MDNGKREDKARRKKPYQKPAMVVVALRPDEAVLGACKTSAASGPGSGGSCSPARCRTQGS